MIRVGWLQDEPNYLGGAELTCREFRAAAPDSVQIVDCPPDEAWEACDVYVIQNCVTYTAETLATLERERVIKYWNDVGPHLQPGVREWLEDYAANLCCSPVQAEYMGMSLDAGLLPPPVDLSRFEQAAASANGRSGIVSVGAWRNYGKAPHRAAEWAGDIGIDFFGAGAFAPQGSTEVPYEAMPALLAQYETFVFLPVVVEPFGRLVAEAWAAGCSVVTNDLVGAKYWIENAPERMDTAGEDFWKLVLS